MEHNESVLGQLLTGTKNIADLVTCDLEQYLILILDNGVDDFLGGIKLIAEHQFENSKRSLLLIWKYCTSGCRGIRRS